jgi:ankyrin repeat protein
MKTKTQTILSGGASVLTRHWNGERDGSRGRSPHQKSFIFIALILVTTLASAATNDLTSALQKGLFEEEANHNLEAAAQAYQTVSAQFDKDRKLAATAIFRLGEVYRKQGKTNEAAAQYERIVREFSDQQTLVTLSRQNLGVLNAPVGTPERIVHAAPGATTSDAAILERIKRLSSSDVRQVLPTLFPDELLTKLLEQYQVAQANGAKITRDYASEHPQMVMQKELLKNLNEQIEDRINGILKALEIRASAATAKTDFGTVAAPTTDDEEKEIRRIQAMIQNSPDLLNALQGASAPLHSAASRGQLKVARFLLDNKANINLRDGAGRTPFMLAASSGHKAMIELLIERGAEVNARDLGGETALHIAAANGYVSVAESLIAHKAEVNARSKKEREGVTPLHQAASQGRPEMVALLISKGAEVDARDANGTTALARAAMQGHTGVVNILLTNGAMPDIEGRDQVTAVGWAAVRGHLDSLKALLAAKADPNAGKRGSPLLLAIANAESVKLLLEAGAKPDLKDEAGETPLLTAIERNYSDSVVQLVRHGADVNLANGKGMTPLQMAVWTENVSTVSLLLTNRAEVNAPGPAGRNALLMTREAMNGYRPSKPGNYGGSSREGNKVAAGKIAALLSERGAQEPPPDKR